MKTVLVTGGAGFIGTHLCEKLTDRGVIVRVLDIAQPTRTIQGVQYILGDIRDLPSVANACEGVDAIAHLAGIVSVPLCQENPLESAKTNVLGTYNILEAARSESKRRGRSVGVLFSSSSAVYGRSGKVGRPIRESDPTAPISVYGEHKLYSERACAQYYELFGVPCIVFRFFNIYGPGQKADSPYSGVISLFSRLARTGEALTVHGSGNQTRDFVSIHDVVDACYKAFSLSLLKWDAEPINIGSGKVTRISSLARLVLTKVKGREIGFIKGPPRSGDVPHSLAHVGRAYAQLKWRARTSLTEGLEALLS